MPFGDLFYIFISDYNESHPQNTIEVTDLQQASYPWIFYKKTAWWKSARYVDPDLTFQDNGIVNNDIIFCQRVNN
jgi:FMN-dependent NADH-azoreductase